MDLDNPDFLDEHPSVVKAVMTAETDQNGISDSMVAQPEEPSYVPPPFKLIVGLEYVLACKGTVKVIAEEKGLFLGLVRIKENPRAMPMWFLPGGEAERNLDEEPEQDPFDVIRIHRAPHAVYLLRDNCTLDYKSNNCFFDRDAAVKAAQERRLEIVTFVESMDD